MGQFPQPKGKKGSLKWVQLLVNEYPELINSPLRKMSGLTYDIPISWLSPIFTDQFAEYRDQAFLDLLDIHLVHRPLGTFWPGRGPQWDALARAGSGEVFLVEAKAHVDEMLSSGTKSSTKSKMLIDRSFIEVQKFLDVHPVVDWSQVLYQYANRLAHLYLLRELNDVQAFLVLLYFVRDREMDGPLTIGEWKSAIKIVKGVLGLPEQHKLSPYVIDIFIDISQMEKGAFTGESITF
ncbi:hypothetical protein ACFLX5_04175 [Chloroflexota bacterium]